MHLNTRASAYLLQGLVLAAAVLLIAGYGFPVGIGVFVGLLLGLAAILAFLAMRPRTSGGATYWISDSRSSDQPDQALLQRHHLESMRVAGVDAGALQRVIPVGRQVQAHGARLELIAVELRDDGGFASFIAHTRPPVGFMGHLVEVFASDDVGTVYAASGQGSGGSNMGTARYELRFAPAPPPTARALTLRIDSFASPFGVDTVRTSGPWEFRVDL